MRRRLLCLAVLLGVGVVEIVTLGGMRERADARSAHKISPAAVTVEGPPDYPAMERMRPYQPPADVDKPPCLGEYRITVYTPYCDAWGYQTATGVTSTHLATCAVDPDIIELGTVLDVGGLLLTAVDTGSAVKGEVIDVFYDGTKDEARAWLTEFGDMAGVWIVEEKQTALPAA